MSNVTLNGQAIGGGWWYKGDAQVLSVAGLNSLTASGTWNAEWTLRWSVASGESGLSGAGTPATRVTTSGAGVLAVSACGLLAVVMGVMMLL